MSLECKTIEVRDKATFIPCVAVLVVRDVEASPGLTDQDCYLLWRSGYGYGRQLVLFGRLDGDSRMFPYDPFDWADRTMRTAHQYVQDHWTALNSGDVVDVQFVLGETASPKSSEREERAG